jgi:hypothetical protein
MAGKKVNRIRVPQTVSLGCSLPSSPSHAAKMKKLQCFQHSCSFIGTCGYIFSEPWLSWFSSQDHEPSTSKLFLPLICFSINWRSIFYLSGIQFHPNSLPFKMFVRFVPLTKQPLQEPPVPSTHPQLWILLFFPIYHTACFHMAYSSTLKMEAAHSSEIFSIPRSLGTIFPTPTLQKNHHHH